VRLAWFTPLSVASAIGAISRRIAEELAKLARIDLWVADEGPLQPTFVPVVRYRASAAFENLLCAYDFVVYNFGDSYPFHRDIYLMSRRVPGIAILHDFVMHHFFASHYLDWMRDPEAYLRAMAALYGPEARADAERSFSRGPNGWKLREGARLWETDRVVEYPFFEEALRGSMAAVVHSEFFRERVARVYARPLERIDLPSAQTIAQAAPRREDLGLPEGRALLLTVGHVNPNKRVHAVVEALGRNPSLASRVVYAVIGELPAGDYRRSLEAAIARYRVRDAVRLLGRASDEDLQRWLANADICINLRHPVMEGGSASLADQLNFGKAVVVSNAGVYAEIPDDCVRKIAPEREAAELPAALQDLLDNPQRRVEMARRGQAYARERFCAGTYAREFLAFARGLEGVAPMVRYADHVAAVLAEMGVRPGMAVIETVARESALLFGDPVTSPWRLRAKDPAG
jgi:glycosyltransferase involved in cell wall biosynthesis